MTPMPVICAVCHEKPTDGAEWEAAVLEQMEREERAAKMGYRAGWERAVRTLGRADTSELLALGPSELDEQLDLEKVEL